MNNNQGNQNIEVNDNIQTNPEGVDNQEASNLNNSNEKPVKMFSEEEVNAIVSKRLAKERAKQEKAAKEAERLSKMSEEERLKAELEIERKKIAEERAELNRTKLLQQTQIELSNREIPREFAEWIVADDAGTTLERINSLKKLWDNALDNGLNVKLAGRAPKIQSDDNKPKPGMSKEEFRKLSIAKQQEIYINDPDLYKKLTER